VTDAATGGTLGQSLIAPVTPMSTDVLAFTVKSFCETFGIGRSLAYVEMAAGRLRARKVGNRTLILRADAEQWADSLPSVRRPAKR
jgi:hypothetical protein